MASERMTVARAMVKALEAEGITTVFGYPGAAICPFYDELISSGIRHILVRHEVNGGHAASGYARMTSSRNSYIGSGCDKPYNGYSNRSHGQHTYGPYHRAGKL